jgi:coronin-1B/1C/6
MRGFKTVGDSYIEPISFLVPRRAEVFQDDIFPPTVGLKPAMFASDWFDGKEGLPPKIDLASIYAGEEPAEVAADYRPARAPSPKAPSPVKKLPPSESESTPAAAAIRSPPPSMNQQTASIKDLASKFTDDKEDVDSDEDSSSFEEIAKPIDRSEKHATPTAPLQKTEPVTTSRGFGGTLSPVSKPDDFDQASQIAATQDTKTQIQKQQGPASNSTVHEPSSPSEAPQPPATKSTVGELPHPSASNQTLKSSEQPIQSSLAEIKSLLETQTKTMTTQSLEISKLTAEVDRLRTKLGE